MTLSGIITGADLIAEFDANRASLESAFALSTHTRLIHLAVEALTSSTVQAVRSVEFTPADDVELELLQFTAEHTGAGALLTLAITQADDETEFLLEKTWSTSKTLSGSATTEDQRTKFTSTSGDRLMLKRGVPYRLAFTLASGTVTRAAGAIVVGGRARKA